MATKWDLRSNALATNNLAYLNDLGLGVPQDRAKAFDLYSRAADLGWAESMWNIANMYGSGQLGPVDMLSACVWVLRARKYAGPTSELQAMTFNVLPRLARTLTPTEMDDCKRRANDWAPTVTNQSSAPGDAPVPARP